MPPVDEATEHFFYLVEHLMRVGPSTHGEVLSFGEIGEWARTNGYRLSGWEAETLRGLSAAYLHEHHAAEDIRRPPPYAPPAPVIERSLVSQRILEMYQRMAGEDSMGG